MTPSAKRDLRNTKTKPIDNTAQTALGHKTAFRIRETKQIKINYSVIEE